MPSYFHCFSVYVWTGESDSNTLREDGYFFSKMMEKTLVFKNIRILVDKNGKKWQKKT